MFDIDFTYAYGRPATTADFRLCNEDFIVDEILGFDLTGEGEHLYIHLRKEGENTGWVAEKIAQYFSVRVMDVGYAGQKDRHAITSQWFSVYLPHKPSTVDWQDFVSKSESNIEILESGWHKQKLRLGMHRANRFQITLKNLTDEAGLDERLRFVDKQGVPNYFGEQRFGRDGGNLLLAQKWFVDGEQIRKKKLRGMVMSAARAYLFNCILQRRVEQNSWQRLLAGDPLPYPSGPLWGRGKNSSDSEVAELEAEVLSEFDIWCERLEHCGLDQERKSLVLKPAEFSWQRHENHLTLYFDLEPGLFATSILREIAQLNNCSHSKG